jgi:hypothetical protein
MESKEIVRRAIEFDNPPRLPFFLGGSWSNKLASVIRNFPNDVCDTWEMDRQESGWYFDNPAPDDWGCKWQKTDLKNMGQVVGHPLEDWRALAAYKLPNPCNPYYFERIEDGIRDAGDKYVVITSHFTLFERLHMLHGFAQTLEDFYLEPEKTHQLLDRILEYKIAHLDEAARRFGDRVNGVFLTETGARSRIPSFLRRCSVSFSWSATGSCLIQFTVTAGTRCCIAAVGSTALCPCSSRPARTCSTCSSRKPTVWSNLARHLPGRSVS